MRLSNLAGLKRAIVTFGQKRPRWSRWLAAVPILALTASVLACNLLPGIPVTPTLAPTLEVSPTPVMTASAIALLPSQTKTNTFTPTVTPLIPTATLTTTPLPSEQSTNTPSFTPVTPTETIQPSATVFTATPSFTPTITPILPTRTPKPTNTPQPSPTVPPPTIPTATLLPTQTLLPSPTFTPTLAPQPVFTRLPTLASVPTLVPTFTFVPKPTLVPTLVPQPTIVPSVPPPATVVVPPPTAPGSVTSVAVVPIIPTSTPIGPIPPPSSGFTVGTEGGTLQGSSGGIRDNDTSVSGHSAVIDQNGRLFLDGALATLPLLQAAQKYTLVRWSPNGRYLAYVLEADNARSGQLDPNLTVDDGLYIYDTQRPVARNGTAQDNPHHVIRNFYRHADQGPYEFRIVVDVTWAPDSVTMLATVINNVGGFASIIVGVDTSAADSRPGLFQLLPFAAGVWLSNSQQFVAVQSGVAVLGIVGRDSHKIDTVVLDGAAVGLWMQNATQIGDGRYAFLGKPSSNGQLQGGPTGLMLYIFAPGGSPVQISQPIPGTVRQAAWNRNNSALLVQTYEGQTFVITLGGGISDYTGRVGGGSVHWR